MNLMTAPYGNLVNPCISTDQCKMPQNHTWVKDPLKSQDRPMTRVTMVSDFTLKHLEKLTLVLLYSKE